MMRKRSRLCASMGVSICALNHVIGATNGRTAGLGEMSRAARNQERLAATLPVTMQRVKLQSSAKPNRTGEGIQPLYDFPHSINYHGAAGVSSVSATWSVNQPVASVRNGGDFRAGGSSSGYLRFRFESRSSRCKQTAFRNSHGRAESHPDAGNQRDHRYGSA